MLAFALAALLAIFPHTSPTLRVGETTTARVDLVDYVFPYGAGFYASNPTVAEVTGRIDIMKSGGTAKITGLRKGKTRLLLQFVGGFSIHEWVVGEITVEERCVPPAVTLDQQHARLVAGETLTVTAMTSGSPRVRVEWYDDGQRLQGAGSTLVLTGLPPGVHRLTARVHNDCGSAASEELLVAVAPRRRSARH
jgi:hypothetical protein